MKKATLGFVTFILLTVLISGCAVTTNTQKEKVTVQLSWFHSAEFIGFYVADQLGYYKDENLDVTIVSGSDKIDSVNEVTSGNAQFGTTTDDAIIRTNFAGQKIVAISAIMRKNPLIVMALKSSGIQKPQDLAGKTVGVVSPNMDTTWDIQFLTMLKALKIDRSSMKFVPNQTYSTDDLKSGLMDASSGLFSTNELVAAQLAGDDVTAIYLSDYGIDVYINTIFRTAQMIKEKPDLVQRFVRATLKGYQYAIEHSEDVTALVLKYDPDLDIKVQAATINAMIPLMDTGDAPLGYMDELVWQHTQKIWLDEKIITSSVDIKSIYTNEFIK